MVDGYSHFLCPHRAGDRPHIQNVVRLLERLVESGFWTTNHPRTMAFPMQVRAEIEDAIEFPVVRYRTGAVQKVTEQSDRPLAEAIDAVYHRRPRMWTLAQQVILDRIEGVQPLLGANGQARLYSELGVTYTHEYSVLPPGNVRVSLPVVCPSCQGDLDARNSPYARLHMAGRGFYATCPHCQEIADLSAHPARHGHPVSEADLGAFPGGGLFRFAVYMDCGPELPDFGPYPNLLEAQRPGLIEEWSKLLDMPLRECGYAYRLRGGAPQS